MNQRGWLVAYRVLFVAFLATAALNMLHVRGGFLTNHTADLVVPAWLYVMFRGLYSPNGRQTLVQRMFGRTPELAAVSLFVASALTEVSQFYWPRGFFAGRFDVLDLLAYAVGLAVCYVADKRSAAGVERGSARDRGAAASRLQAANHGERRDMSRNIETVSTYLDGFRRNDHQQILSCLTDDIEWTVFGAFRLTGKAAYDKAIDGAPEFIDPPELEIVRMVEQGDVVMAELTGTARRAVGGEMRMSMAEVFVMRDGKIAERRAWVIALKDNDYR